jgi:hypothetical protein
MASDPEVRAIFDAWPEETAELYCTKIWCDQILYEVHSGLQKSHSSVTSHLRAIA